MKQTPAKLLSLIATIAFVFFAPRLCTAAEEQLPAGVASPMEEVRDTVDQVVKVAVSLTGDGHKAKRREELRKIIEPRFDFVEMAKRSMGSSWLNMTAAQQDEFVDVFSALLARTYLERIETVEEKMVTIDSQTLGYPKALVKTSVRRKGDVFPLDYRLHYKDGTWKVYDVIIENIGLVSNYRNEFSGIIRKDGVDGLITRLKEKEQKH